MLEYIVKGVAIAGIGSFFWLCFKYPRLARQFTYGLGVIWLLFVIAYYSYDTGKEEAYQNCTSNEIMDKSFHGLSSEMAAPVDSVFAQITMLQHQQAADNKVMRWYVLLPFFLLMIIFNLSYVFEKAVHSNSKGKQDGGSENDQEK